jgi:putative addiction module component (TIGR02574 family)
MTSEAERILEAALQLPEADRVELAAILEDSVGDGSTDEEIEAAWIAEVKRRMEDVESGRSKPIPWEEVRQELFSMVGLSTPRRASAG